MGYVKTVLTGILVVLFMNGYGNAQTSFTVDATLDNSDNTGELLAIMKARDDL